MWAGGRGHQASHCATCVQTRNDQAPVQAHLIAYAWGHHSAQRAAVAAVAATAAASVAAADTTSAGAAACAAVCTAQQGPLRVRHSGGGRCKARRQRAGAAVRPWQGCTGAIGRVDAVQMGPGRCEGAWVRFGTTELARCTTPWGRARRCQPRCVACTRRAGLHCQARGNAQ